jgi:hypothetical protein
MKPGSLGSKTDQDLAGTAGTIELEVEMMIIGLADVLEKTPREGKLSEDLVDFNPVQRHRTFLERTTRKRVGWADGDPR